MAHVTRNSPGAEAWQAPPAVKRRIAVAGLPLAVAAVFTFLWAPRAAEAKEPNELVQTVCIACHNQYAMTAGLNLQDFDAQKPYLHPEIAEKMIRKLRAGQMPPKELAQPEEDIMKLVYALENGIADAVASQKMIGARPYQRLNRAEYARLVYDVLGLTVEPAEWLPEDQISASFDNIADVQGMSATVLTAYMNAASDIARRAVGHSNAPLLEKTYTNSPLVSQHEWEHIEGAPYGTRGGISVLHTFPADGYYSFSMRFRLGWGQRFHDIDLSVDGERVALVPYGGDIDYQGRMEFPIASEPVFIRAGERQLSAAFIRQMDGPYEDLIQPHERSLAGIAIDYGTTAPPHLMQLTVAGPANPVGVSESASRKRIFSCRPTSEKEEIPCAEEIVSRLAAKAYGQDLSKRQLADLMGFYSMGAADGGFELGIRTALEAVLSSPDFLFRMESEPRGVRPGDIYRLSDFDLASRLSFFLWGTNPDSELMALARAGKLSNTRTLTKQAERLLEDPRSIALATRFASLWLRLQDLENVYPDEALYPDYNTQLMKAMRRETILFFDHLVRADKSLLELYRADYSFMNERLASHYGIPGVIGDEFRLVKYPDDRRKGIFGHGSILTQTSLANRTSPVLRGIWAIDVLLGTPPPPPPPGIPDLEETDGVQNGEVLTTRRRMEMHRSNAICAACHTVIDPVGLSLDNFDVVGQWRIRENGAPLDTRSTFWDGTEIETLTDLSDALLKRPLPLVREFTARLMSFAIGRRIEWFDQPTVRRIVDEAEKGDYRMSSLIMGVILSDQFRMKQAAEPDDVITADTAAR